jgi:hypothetical protein
MIYSLGYWKSVIKYTTNTKLVETGLEAGWSLKLLNYYYSAMLTPSGLSRLKLDTSFHLESTTVNNNIISQQ